MSVEMNVDKTEKNDSSAKPEPESVSIPGYDSFEQFTKEGFKTLVEAIRHSNALPSGSDWTFYKTHESFTKIMDNEGNTIQKLINSVLRKNDIKGSIRNRIVEDATELIVEANDTILEKVANNIDEMNGIKKTVPLPIVPQVVSAQLPINGSWNRVNSATFSVSSSIPSNQQSKVSSIRLLTAKNIVRPQKFFKDKICNSSDYPWEPRIKEKPNSLKPLAIFLEETEQGNEYSHPYEYELERFTPPNEQLQRETPLVPKPVTETELVEVETAEQLDQLLEDLRKCKIFVVDLEHHSYRSFMGITCLMQISTHEKDYLIDTLALRDKLYILNEVFTKPSIIKVFHGADMDIRWLQRDLSLYVVNMFDTYQASKALEYSQLSLAYLLQRFCNFTANKQFQLADWRIRPLPEELKSYAREDTHYLIYIYQKLKCELIDKANGQVNLVKSVFERSTETCLLRYFKPVLREDSYMDFYRKCKRMFDNRQLYALKELYKWRDEISREEDESTGYVLPNHMLLQISESLPREMQGILACCNPIPPLVKAHLMTLHNIILQARDRPLNKPILQEDTRARGQTKRVSKINVDSPLNCPHDLTKSSEFRDDLTTLLGKEFNLKDIIKGFNEILSVEQVEPSCSVFGTPIEDKKENKSKLESIKFLGPFERYKLVKPFIKAEEEAEAARKAAEAEKAKETQETESQPQEPNTEKTDAQRIESIRDHFLTLNRQTEEQNRSLIEMGGSKKRKREEDDEDDDYQEQTSLPEKYASTPAPLPHNAYRNFGGKNRKRKSGDNLQGDAKHFKGNSAQDSPQKTPNKKRKRGKKGKIQPTEQNETQPHPDQPKNRGRFNRGRPYRQRGSHNDRPSDQGPSTEDFSAYDYASVDYRQFQGGAGSVQNPREFKSTFKTRGKKKGPGQNKRFNQSQTFGSNFRGRGRGRGRGR